MTAAIRLPARRATYEQYRDALIRHAFARKARQYLGAVEMEVAGDSVMRHATEQRRLRLEQRFKESERVIVAALSDKSINHRVGGSSAPYAYPTQTSVGGDTASDDTHCDLAPVADMKEPRVNINGLPMYGGIDVQGNPFGSTTTDNGY